MDTQRKIILWSARKHSGKTTAAAGLVERLRSRGVSVAGLLAPSVYEDGVLIGFDALDVSTGQRGPLLRVAGAGEPKDAGRFAFREEGLLLGRAALCEDVYSPAGLVVVDEFGPLELRGGGWRVQVDCLAGQAGPILLLVVRENLTGRVGELYSHRRVKILPATSPASADRVEALATGGR